VWFCVLDAEFKPFFQAFSEAVPSVSQHTYPLSVCHMMLISARQWPFLLVPCKHVFDDLPKHALLNKHNKHPDDHQKLPHTIKTHKEKQK